jgi:hypothetical protein
MATQRKTASSRFVQRCAEEQLKASYGHFLAENDPGLKNEAGKDLIRAIFGTDAIAEDSIR